jgi:hypothetical protein
MYHKHCFFEDVQIIEIQLADTYYRNQYDKILKLLHEKNCSLALE